MIAGLVNWFIRAIGGAITWILGLLPQSPFSSLAPAFSGQEKVWIGWVNYFIPISDMMASFALFLGIVVLYYGVRVVMSWVKVLGQ